MMRPPIELLSVYENVKPVSVTDVMVTLIVLPALLVNLMISEDELAPTDCALVTAL